MNRRIWIGSLVILAALGFIVFKGLGDATVFFKTADEAVRDKAELGTKRFRVEGVVVTQPQSQGDGIAFRIENKSVPIDVVHRGEQPRDTFRLGIPVVLEGRWNGDHYASDRIMVRHTEDYRADNPDRVKDYPPDSQPAPTAPAPSP